MERQKYSNVALISLLISIILGVHLLTITRNSIFIQYGFEKYFPILAIISLIFAVYGLNKIKTQKLGGRWIAIIAITILIILILLFLINAYGSVPGAYTWCPNGLCQ